MLICTDRLLDLLPFVALGVGYLMVSKFRYVHVGNKYLKGRKPAEYLTAIIFGAALAVLFPEIVAALLFCGFALSGPLLSFRNWMVGTSGSPEAAAAPAASSPEPAQEPAQTTPTPPASPPPPAPSPADDVAPGPEAELREMEGVAIEPPERQA